MTPCNAACAPARTESLRACHSIRTCSSIYLRCTKSLPQRNATSNIARACNGRSNGTCMINATRVRAEPWRWNGHNHYITITPRNQAAIK
jgi:hypothetical protein